MKSIPILLFLAWASVAFSQTAIDSGLVAYYPFNGNVFDYSGQNNNGTIIGELSFVPDRWGNPNSAAYFNGTNAYVKVPASTSLDTLVKSMTLACTFYTKGYGAIWASLLSKSIGTYAQRQYSIIYDEDGLISFGHSLAAMHLIPKNEWHHLAITYGDSIIKCYLDGILLDSNIISYELKKTNYPLAIGADPHIVMEYHYGMIDEVRVYNRALSAAEVSVISTVNTSATQERPNDLKITFYPNPTEGILTMVLTDIPGKWSLTMYDQMGKTMMTHSAVNQTETIDCSGFPPGVYLVKVATSEEFYTTRIIKL
ncbi:MAG: T9SS type A sorting domain-containing protein [Saprospiraceae bacterium]|nr:T9SS type A sorting domain-containing protein [Saprospiraceae bacterium]